MKGTLLILVFFAVTTGCSNKAVYDNVRIYQRNECVNEPPSTYFECIERANKSYEEYERERKEVLEKPESDVKIPKTIRMLRASAHYRE